MVVAPSTVCDSSNCLGMEPRLNDSPMPWTMADPLGVKTRSRGLLEPAASRSCSLISFLITRIADDGTTVAWLTMAEVTGKSVVTLKVPLPSRSWTRSSVLG